MTMTFGGCNDRFLLYAHPLSVLQSSLASKIDFFSVDSVTDPKANVKRNGKMAFDGCLCLGNGGLC